MKTLKKINVGLAIKTILIILTLLLVFHVLIVVGIIPYQYVWGGRLKSKEEMMIFESISILINLFVLSIVLMRAGIIELYFSNNSIKVFNWLFSILFGLNTIGNLFSLTSIETIVATPITLILTIMFLRLSVD